MTTDRTLCIVSTAFDDAKAVSKLLPTSSRRRYRDSKQRNALSATQPSTIAETLVSMLSSSTCKLANALAISAMSLFRFCLLAASAIAIAEITISSYDSWLSLGFSNVSKSPFIRARAFPFRLESARIAPPVDLSFFQYHVSFGQVVDWKLHLLFMSPECERAVSRLLMVNSIFVRGDCVKAYVAN